MLEVTPQLLRSANAGSYKPSIVGKVKGLLSGYEKLDNITLLTTDEVLLLDISFYQVFANFQTMLSNKVRGTIIRAGQNTWKDDKAEEYMTDAEKEGMPIGSYWFYDSRSTPQSQAKLWKEVLGNHKTKLMCWADYEETYGGPYGGWRKLYDFLEECKRIMPDRKFGIYTGYYYWLEHSPLLASEQAYFADYDLWLAFYTNDFSLVKIPKPWTKMVFWQYTSSGDGTRLGVGSKEVDKNRFIGTHEEFKTMFKLEGEEPVPDITFEGSVKPGVIGLVVRNSPAGTDTGQRLVENAPIQGVGTLVTATLNGTSYDWMNIVSPVVGWVADKFLDYHPVNPTPTTHKLEVVLDGEIVFTKEF